MSGRWVLIQQSAQLSECHQVRPSQFFPLTTYYMVTHQKSLRTYTKIVPFKEKSSFHFVVLWQILNGIFIYMYCKSFFCFFNITIVIKTNRKIQLVNVFNDMKLCWIFLYFVICIQGVDNSSFVFSLGKWGVLKQIPTSLLFFSFWAFALFTSSSTLKVPLIFLKYNEYRENECNYEDNFFFFYITIIYSTTSGLYNDLRCSGKQTCGYLFSLIRLYNDCRGEKCQNYTWNIT
jgi:hypothetical protein